MSLILLKTAWLLDWMSDMGCKKPCQKSSLRAKSEGKGTQPRLVIPKKRDGCRKCHKEGTQSFFASCVRKG